MTRPGKRLVARRRQRGVVLLFALIALLVLLIGAVALVRSFNTSLFMAGNIGFKRDLQNQSELVTTKALAAFASGAPLGSRAARSTSSSPNSPANAPAYGSYSATILSVDRQGIPDVLTRTDRRDQSGATPQFELLPKTNDFAPVGSSFTITYVIDRLCASAGDEKVLGSAQCAVTKTPPAGGGISELRNSDSRALAAGLISSAPGFVLYRLSARITGPRNTVSFFQSTFAVPS